MREIKYKAFHKLSKKFEPIISINFRAKQVLFEFELGWQDFENVELIEFAKLNDNRGRELYFDSSIVKLPEYSGLFICTKDDFGIPMFCHPKDVTMNQTTFEEYFLSFISKKRNDFEIIGTTQENADLLK